MFQLGKLSLILRQRDDVAGHNTAKINSKLDSKQLLQEIAKVKTSYKLDTQAILCRKESEPIAGLFVNTDPKGAKYNRESHFQAKKIEELINEVPQNSNKLKDVVTKANAYTKGYPNFKSAQEVADHIKTLEGADASTFTRGSGLQQIYSNTWYARDKFKAMHEVQLEFIEQGGQRGKDYALNLLALKLGKIAIVESSRVDDNWGIKTGGTIYDSGSGQNNLGAIHGVVANQLEKAWEDALSHGEKSFTFQGITITQKDIEFAQHNIELATFNVAHTGVYDQQGEITVDGVLHDQHLTFFTDPTDCN